MYDKLPLDFIGITDGFGKRASGMHYGTDFGWNQYKGENIYSSNDCEVILNDYGVNLGNYVVTKYENETNTIINRYLHLKDKALVNKGDKVKQGQIIGYMGNTGDSTGVHLHFEYWICPKNYIYNYADRSKYAVNPLDYCYLFEEQKVSNKNINDIKRVVGIPVTKNTDKNQIQIIKKELNVRENMSLSSKSIGYAILGYYDILDEGIADNYNWYKIGENKWVASLKEYNIIIPQKNDILFLAPKSDYYYIYLYKGDSVVIKKSM